MAPISGGSTRTPVRFYCYVSVAQNPNFEIAMDSISNTIPFTIFYFREFLRLAQHRRLNGQWVYEVALKICIWMQLKVVFGGLNSHSVSSVLSVAKKNYHREHRGHRVEGPIPSG